MRKRILRFLGKLVLWVVLMGVSQCVLYYAGFFNLIERVCFAQTSWTVDERPMVHEIGLKIENMRPDLDPGYVWLIAHAVYRFSGEYGLKPELVLSVMANESSFNLMARSHKNCVGLMQINPVAHADKLEKYGISIAELYHIDNNVMLGCEILREKIDAFGSVGRGLYHYVGGDSGYVINVLALYD